MIDKTADRERSPSDARWTRTAAALETRLVLLGNALRALMWEPRAWRWRLGAQKRRAQDLLVTWAQWADSQSECEALAREGESVPASMAVRNERVRDELRLIRHDLVIETREFLKELK